MALTQTQVSQLYVAIFNRASEGEGNTYWQNSTDAATAATAMLATADAQAYFGTSLDTDEDFIAHIYANTFNKTVAEDPDGIAYWVGRLTDGESRGSVVAAILVAATDPANAGDAQDQFNNRVAVSDYMAANLDAAPADYATSTSFSGDLTVTNDAATVTAAESDIDELVNDAAQVTGDTFYLTEGQDIVTGTADNDTFIARGNGALDNADVIDGGAGIDTIEVMLDNNETAESPLVTNVEILKVQGQAITTDSGDNDVDGLAAVESNIDAGDMESVYEYWSEDSRADVAIEDISHNSHITTVGMRETDPAVSYYTFFDPENITAPGQVSSGATLLIKLANVYNIAEGENPVGNFSALTFDVGTTTVTVDVTTATDYPSLVTAIEDGIAAAGLTGLDVQAQAAEPAYFSIDIEAYTAGTLAGSYNPILITNSGEEVLSAGTITLADAATSGNMTNTMTNTAGSATPALTQVDVVFDRVGKNSKGGDFVAGSDSTGASGSAGIQQFNVQVDRDSWLNSVASTNDTLEVINIENIDDNSDGTGSIRIDSVSDVRVINASTMDGSANITATLSDNVVAKYLDLTDDQANPAADNSDDAALNVVDTYFSYDFGSNDDTFNLTIAEENLAAAGSTTREDFVLEINGGEGDDTVTVNIDDAPGITAAGYINSKMNANLTINTDEGDDVVNNVGEGDWIITTGAGADTIYSDNTGTQKATWVVNAADMTDALAAGNERLIDDLQSDTNDTYNLYKGTVSVTFKGLVATATIPGGSDYTTSDLEINQAIKDAINNDATLSKLVVAEDGPANTLLITSLIDGVAVEGTDLVIGFAAPVAADLSVADITAINTAWGTAYADAAAAIVGMGAAVATLNTAETDYDAHFVDDGAADIDGTNSVAGGANAAADTTITAGTGNDIIVLSTKGDDTGADGDNLTSINTADLAASNETVVYDAAFGNDVIVNFTADADVTAGEFSIGSDILDFRAFLSAGVATTLNAGVNADSNITVAALVSNGDAVIDAGENDNVAAIIQEILTDDVAANNGVYITVDAANVGTVYSIVDGDAASDIQVTALGTIDLADTAWATLTVDNFA